MANEPDHDHAYGEWRRDEARDWWARYCTVEGCEWRQVKSDDPAISTPMSRAMDRLVGIVTERTEP